MEIISSNSGNLKVTVKICNYVFNVLLNHYVEYIAILKPGHSAKYCSNVEEKSARKISQVKL